MDNTSLGSNYTCGLPTDFPSSLNIPPTISYIQAGIALITGIAGFLLNVFVLFIIGKYRALHQRLMYIAVQIVVIEITYSVAVPPAIFVSGLARDWLLGDVMCNILAVINDGFAIFRFMMTLVLTLDRFVSVFLPFFYQMNSKKILIILLSLVYIISFFRVVLPLTGIMSCYTYLPTNKICTVYPGCSTACYYFAFVSIVLIILFGALLPFCLYMIMFCKAYKIMRKTKTVVNSSSSSFYTGNDESQSTSVELKNYSSSIIHPETLTDPVSIESGEISFRKTDQPKSNRVRNRESVISTSVIVSNRDNLRVTVTMFILLMSVIGCTAPAFTLYMVQVVSLHNQSTFFILIMLLGRTCFNSIPVVDAIAIMRDGQFRMSAARFFKSVKIMTS